MTTNWVQRVVRGRDRGSVYLTESEQRSLITWVKLEIESFVHEKYVNYKYPVPQNFYGYCQVFNTNSFVRDIQIGIPQNDISWQFNPSLIAIQELRYRDIRNNEIASILSESTLPEDFPTPLEGLEIPLHRENHFKFQSFGLCSFTFRIFHYPLDILNTYGEASTWEEDNGEERNADGDYVDPQKNEADDPWNGVPDSSIPDNGTSPGDFPEPLGGDLGEYPAGTRVRVYVNNLYKPDCSIWSVDDSYFEFQTATPVRAPFTVGWSSVYPIGCGGEQTKLGIRITDGNGNTTGELSPYAQHLNSVVVKWEYFP